MKTKVTILILLFTALLLVFLPYSVNPEPNLPTALREEFHVQSIGLTKGVIHYEELGSGDTSILYIPGFSIPMFVWDKQFESIASKGYRSIRFNYYSRGFSDAPESVYTKKEYAALVNELVDSLKLTNVIAVGHSLGGAVSAEAVLMNPENYSGVVLSDPMLDGKTGNPATAIINIPVLGVWLNRLFVGRVIEKRANELLTKAHYSDTSHYRQEMHLQTRTKGYHNSIVEIFRGDLLNNSLTQYEKLDSLSIPVLLICGSPEEITPDTHPAIIREALPNAVFFEFPEAYHMAHVTAYREVNRKIVQFIESLSSDSILQESEK